MKNPDDDGYIVTNTMIMTMVVKMSLVVMSDDNDND